MHLPERVITYSFPLVILAICNFLFIDASQQRCVSPVVAEVGSRLKTQCEFDAFHSLDWFYGREEANTGSPFIYSEESVVKGSGYVSGEFDVSLDGSLIIKNVSFSHDRTFTVKYYRATDLAVVITDVEVKVLVPPEPRYPVVEVNLPQRKVANLSCSLKRIWPNVGLEMVIVNTNKDVFTLPNYTYTLNGDGTFNLDVVGLYPIDDSATDNLPIVQCKLLQPIYETYLKAIAVTIPVAGFIPSALRVPVIDGCYSRQDHCSLRVDKVGEVTCSVKEAGTEFRLHWEMDTTNASKRFFFIQNSYSLEAQESIVASYITTDNTLQSVILRCVMSSSEGMQSVAVVTLRIHSENSTAETHFDPCIHDKIDPAKPIERATVHLLWVFIAAVLVVVVSLAAHKVYKFLMRRKRKKLLEQLFAEHLKEAMPQISQDEAQTGANSHSTCLQLEIDTHSIQQGAECQMKQNGMQLDSNAYRNMMISQLVDQVLSIEGSGEKIHS